MMALLPDGKLWRFVASMLREFFLACAQELARLDARADDLLRESNPSTAVELLPEYEQELDIGPAVTIAERQANVVARRVRRQRFRPVDFQTALAPLLAQAAADVVVIERTRAFCVSVGDDPAIYRFFIYRDPSLPGTYFLASAQTVVDEMSPSHTVGQVIESVNFRCDDAFSLCDRDLLGA
jgi:uncharacterized protein YmfQ (DUF2313 family)